jgi:hypothetical protein
MPGRHEWNPLADEDRNDVDVELIDLAGIEEGRDQFSPTIIQICLPGIARRRRANAFTGSDTNATPRTARFSGFRENT